MFQVSHADILIITILIIEILLYYVFIAIETSGAFGEIALAFFRKIGKLLRLKTNDSQSFFHLLVYMFRNSIVCLF